MKKSKLKLAVSCFSGEKIGIEYLFSQTGDVLDKPLEEEPDAPESTSSNVEHVEEEAEADEGFVEAVNDVEDMTIAEPMDVVLSTGMLLLFYPEKMSNFHKDIRMVAVIR